MIKKLEQYFKIMLERKFFRWLKDNRQKILTFTVFLFLSTSFWFLSVLNERYTTQIRYPIRFSNFPSDKAALSDLPTFLELKIESHGFKLLGYHTTTPVNPIMLDLNLFLIDSAKSNPELFAPTIRLFSSVSNQLSDEVRLIEIQPDTLRLQYSPIIKKKVPVLSRILYQIPKQHILKQLSITPDSIVISGMAHVLDTIEYVATSEEKIKRLKLKKDYQVSLDLPAEVKCTQKKVNLRFFYEEFTEASMTLPIEVYNLPEGFGARLFPDQVSITYMVGLSDYEKVQAYQFSVIAYYEAPSEAEWNEQRKLKLEIKKQPSFILSPQINPTYVDYLLVKHD